MSTEAASPTDDLVDAEWERPALWTRVYDWQLDDVVAGKVSDGALRLWLALGRYSRKLDRPAYPSSRTLMTALQVGDRHLRTLFVELKTAGWVSVRTEVGERFFGGRRRVTMLHETRHDGANGSDPPGLACPNPPEPSAPNPPEAPGPHSYPEEIGGDGKRRREGLPAQSPPAEISQGRAPAKRKAPDWIVALGSELREIYPHGIKESGEIRRPTPKVTTERLRIALSKPDGRIKENAEEIAAEMVRVAKLLAAVPRTLEDRKFMQSLDVWINQGGWENPPEVGPKPKQRLERGELTDAPTFGWKMSPKQIAEKAAEEADRQKQHAKDRRNDRIKAGTATAEEVAEKKAEDDAENERVARMRARGGPVYSYPDTTRKTEPAS